MSAAHALIEEWRRHLVQDRRRSLHIVRAYMATAERLVAFLQEHQRGAVTRDALAALNAADLRAFLANRRMDGIGNNSTARELSARSEERRVGKECVKPCTTRRSPQH